ncbi:MAG: hypothetical protein AAB401_08460 [Acidobacteriota bacterium]
MILYSFSLKRLLPILFTSILFSTPSISAQQSKSNSPSRRLSFAEAQKLLFNQKEGNLDKQPGKFTRTKLSDGRVLELFYPLTANSSPRKGRAPSVPGYGLLYESEAAFKETTRPRHALEDLIPDGRVFVGSVPLHVMKLEKRVGKLDYTRGSLRRLDSLIAGYHASHTTAQTDGQTFQQVTAYYGEVLRRELKGEWRAREVKLGLARVQVEPNIQFVTGGKTKEIRPWSTVLQAMSNEDVRGVRLSKLFEDELRAAQQ